MTHRRNDAIRAFALAIPGDPSAPEAIRMICERFGLAYEEARQLLRQSSFPRRFRPRPLAKSMAASLR